MKIAFVSDTHFGYPRFEADAHVQGYAAIRDACARADVLVLGGDIFDSRNPSLETVYEVAAILREAGERLARKDAGGRLRARWADGTPSANPYVLGIHGTHERKARDALNPLAMMARLGWMEDLHNRTLIVERGPGAEEAGRGAKGVGAGEAAGRESAGDAGGATRSAPGAAGEGEADSAAFSGMGGIPDEVVGEALKRLSCRPAEGMPNIFIFHQTLQEFIPGAPLPHAATVEDLPGGYDWYLCGHIHARREHMGGRLLIPGSTVLTQMQEGEQGDKGYYLIDTLAEKGKQSEFVPIKTRPFILSELEFDRAQPLEVRRRAEEEIRRLEGQAGDEAPIVRIRLKGSLAPGSGPVDLEGLSSNRLILSLDNRLDGGSLAAELARIKGDRAARANGAEMGVALLRQNAQAAGMDPQRAQEWFDELGKEE